MDVALILEKYFNGKDNVSIDVFDEKKSLRILIAS